MKKTFLFYLLLLFIWGCEKPTITPDEPIDPSIENPVNIYVISDNENTYIPIENATVIWKYEIDSQYVNGDTTQTTNTGFIIADIPKNATKVYINVRVNRINSILSINYTLTPCPINNFNNPVNNNNPWGITNNYHYFVFALSDIGGWRIHSSVKRI